MSGTGTLLGYLAAAAAALTGDRQTAAITQLQPPTPTLRKFSIGPEGGFPYIWQDPSTLEFNASTYRWINSSLRPGIPSSPVQLEGVFTNQFIQVLGSISFSLSTADQSQLGRLRSQRTERQANLLRAWLEAFDKFPVTTSSQQPIDAVLHTIATTWAVPQTTLAKLQAASKLGELTALLNKTPKQGLKLLSALSAYLEAIAAGSSLIDAVSSNTGELRQVLAALQTPSAENGALRTDDGQLQPAFEVHTPVTDIQKGLSQDGQKVEFQASVSRTAKGRYQVTVPGSGEDAVLVSDFLNLSPDGGSDIFAPMALRASLPIEMSFQGVTSVRFKPSPFDPKSGENWYWPQPIQAAISNGTSDVTGFKFSPTPQIDFSTGGSFGFLTQVVISRHPTIRVTVGMADFSQIQKLFEGSESLQWRIKFLGTPLQTGASGAYAGAASLKAADKVLLTFSPPALSTIGSSNPRAWVLGVKTEYPADRHPPGAPGPQ